MEVIHHFPHDYPKELSWRPCPFFKGRFGSGAHHLQEDPGEPLAHVNPSVRRATYESCLAAPSAFHFLRSWYPFMCPKAPGWPPHHSPLAHRAPGGAPAGLGSFSNGGNAGSSWVAVLRGHPRDAGTETGVWRRKGNCGAAGRRPRLNCNPPATLANQRFA